MQLLMKSFCWCFLLLIVMPFVACAETPDEGALFGFKLEDRYPLTKQSAQTWDVAAIETLGKV